MNLIATKNNKSKPLFHIQLLVQALALLFYATQGYALGPTYEEDMSRQHAQEQQIMEENYQQGEEAAAMEQEAEPMEQENQMGYSNPIQSLLNSAVDMVKFAASSTAKSATLSQDPKFQRYQQGGWDFFQSKIGTTPGEFCTAFFWKKNGFVSLSGPGGDYKGALMTFWGQDIPRPPKQTQVQVTLKQGKDAPQTVNAFNFFKPGSDYGAIAFAVPSIQALLDGMEDTLNFELIMDGKTVAQVDWHSGLMARGKLNECVTAKKL